VRHPRSNAQVLDVYSKSGYERIRLYAKATALISKTLVMLQISRKRFVVWWNSNVFTLNKIAFINFAKVGTNFVPLYSYKFFGHVYSSRLT
jgi:hypothetical protein